MSAGTDLPPHPVRGVRAAPATGWPLGLSVGLCIPNPCSPGRGQGLAWPYGGWGDLLTFIKTNRCLAFHSEGEGQGCGFSVQVQFGTYLLWVCLIIPFSKMSGECSLETERKKQKNIERRLYFSLQKFFRAVSCDRAATLPTRSKNPIWGLNSTSEIATPSQRLPERMISFKSCSSNNRVPGCPDHKMEEINSKQAEEKKKIPVSKQYMKCHEILLLSGLIPITIMDLFHGGHFIQSQQPGHKYGPKEKTW